MISKILSLMMSFVIGLSGTAVMPPDEFIDSVTGALFGIPLTSGSVEDGFLDSLDGNDIAVLNDVSGILKNKALIIINKGMGFFERLRAFKSENIKAIGWCMPVDAFVVKIEASSPEEIKAGCNLLEALEWVTAALPITASKTAPQSTPNDPFDGAQWDELDPDGKEYWLETVEARRAWDYSEYYSPVTLGVVDCGFRVNHPDLAGKIGFTGFFQKLINSPNPHGTHVAGIIAAERDNGIGIAGLCSQAKLICKDWEPFIALWNTNLNILFGFASEVKAGARVVNFSIGKSENIESGKEEKYDNVMDSDRLLFSLFTARLISKGYDFLCVQSAGNGNSAGDPVDAYYNGLFCSFKSDVHSLEADGVPYEEIAEKVIIVGSVGKPIGGRYYQSDYSNTGTAVDITAPGESVYSTCTVPDYAEMSGTSMAAPMVTAAAGLIFSAAPELSAAQVKNILLSATDKTALPAEGTREDIAVELPVLNAAMCVETALMMKNGNFGIACGKADIGTEKNAVLSYDGREYTVYSDGSYRFAAPAGKGTAKILSGDSVISEFEIEIIPEAK